MFAVLMAAPRALSNRQRTGVTLAPCCSLATVLVIRIMSMTDSETPAMAPANTNTSTWSRGFVTAVLALSMAILAIVAESARPYHLQHSSPLP
ncbi:MAG: hypothetical protein IPG23_27465 [Burkholderiales bacterium]|nr:hypothetical protein [Burkholderiales bacterium]